MGSSTDSRTRGRTTLQTATFRYVPFTFTEQSLHCLALEVAMFVKNCVKKQHSQWTCAGVYTKLIAASCDKNADIMTDGRRSSGEWRVV